MGIEARGIKESTATLILSCMVFEDESLSGHSCNAIYSFVISLNI